MKIESSLSVLILFIFGIGCDVSNTFEPIGESGTDLQETVELKKTPVTVLYQLSFEETKTIYSTRKPAGLEKPQPNKFTLTGYERTHKSVTIDQKGFLHITTEWLDGSADINMPLEVWKRTSDIRPAPPHNYKPIAKSQIGNGYIRYFAQDGGLINEYKIDASALKVNPQEFNSMLSNTREQKNDTARVADNLERLQNRNVNFERIGKHFAEIASYVENDSKVVRQKQILDLRIGRAIKSFDYRADGKIQNWDVMDYAQKDGIPVLRNSISEIFADDENNNWSLATRTVINRKNIELYIN